MDRRLLLAAALGAALAPRPARADGPVPHTTSVHLQPGGQRILLGSDSGLLISDDGGASFHWVCGEAYGVSNLYQPKHAVTASGEMYATTPDGLRLSRDGGCTWELLGEPVGQGTTVVTVGPDGRVWAASTAQHRPNDVYRSVDGAAFESTGLSAEGVWWLSVLTTSDPGRVYASGTRLPVGETPGEALLRRSDDGGDTWQELPVDPFAFGGSTPYLFLLGVAPADPDLLFARAAGVAQGGDAVYRSTDGGQSWAHVLDMGGPVDGFVVREDGATVIVGSRYPCRGEAGSGQGCVRISQDVGQSYRPAELQPHMACLTERDGVLYACGKNSGVEQFALGTSRDGDAWSALYRFEDTAGPLECPADTIQARRCAAALWPPMCETFGACERRPDAGPSIQGPPVDPPGGSCRLAPGGGLPALPAALAVLALAAAARRSRRRVRRGPAPGGAAR